ILAAAREILFGQIDVEGACTAGCSAYGKRAGISKAVQQVLWCDMTQVTAILSLVQEEARRITCGEVDSELQMPFGGSGLQTLARIANNQTRRLRFSFFRKINRAKTRRT